MFFARFVLAIQRLFCDQLGATLTAPLLSLQAAGSIGKTLTYYRRMGTDCVREWVKPQNPDSADQQHIRGIFAMAVEGWQNTLDATSRAVWDDDENRPTNNTGFNFYQSTYIQAMLAGTTPPTSPP